MKTLKLSLAIIVIVMLTITNSQGQIFKAQSIVTIDHLDYGPPIGEVYGTYTYSFTFKLSESGLIEGLHWNVVQCDLQNENGDKVKVIDSGLDTKGIIWSFFNYPNASNTGYPITYNVTDGWLNDIMPTEMPVEGSFVNMSLKLICKGKMFKWYGLLQFHLNANGELTAEVTKGWLEQ